MEVNIRNVMSPSSYQVTNNTAAVNIGSIAPVTIKERTGDNRASVLLKGQEQTVQFEGPVPTQDHVLVEVTNKNDNGQLVVKQVNNSASYQSNQSVDDLLKSSGFDPKTDTGLKQAAAQIITRGGAVSQETLQNLQDFLNNDPGSLEEKLDTIKVMQQKNIEFTPIQLTAVNEALHGQSIVQSLSNLVNGPIQISSAPDESQAADLPSILEQAVSQLKNETDRSAVIDRVLSTLDPVQDAQLIADIKKAMHIQAAGKDRIVNSMTDSDLKQAVQQEPSLTKIIQLLKTKQLPSNVATAVQEAEKLEKIGNTRLEAVLRKIFSTSENVEASADSPLQNITKLIQKEPSIEKVLEGIQSLFEKNSSQAPDLSVLYAAFEKASNLAGQGRELAARKELSTAIKQIQDNNPQLNKNDTADLSKVEQYVVNEAVQSLHLDSKNILVTQITTKLSQLAIDFKQMKREVSRNLDSVSKLIEVNKNSGTIPAKQMLDATINKLDKAILKSDFMLYTDMSTEKKMLDASSRLAEAKNLLNKGSLTEADQIVKEVKDVVDKLIFKPSDNRIKHFVSDQELLSPKSMLEKMVSGQQAGARKIFDTVKSLGLMHENDTVHALADKEDAPNNLKSLLLQMMEKSDGEMKIPHEQTIANITGQQLLNKQDSSGIQNLFVQLPILLNKQIENVKVFVNSQKKSEKIDWENCSLYFVLETKKLGDVGISISAVNRNLSITFKNNQESFQKAVEPLTASAKERLQEIGYNVGSIQFKTFSNNSEMEKIAGETHTAYTPTFSEKGYDFTI